MCDASWEVANAIQAELSLKVDEDKLISIINAAADVIRLTSNRLVIDSTYFKLDDSGRAELAGGKVGNWEIGEALSSTAEAYVAPGEYERARVKQKILGTSTLSTAETQYLDVTGDGNINISDLVTIQKILLGMTEYEECNNPKKSEVTVELNPTTPNKLIKMAATTPWGRKKESYLGINGIKFPTICGECVTGDTIETTSGVNLDELNSNLSLKVIGDSNKDGILICATITGQSFSNGVANADISHTIPGGYTLDNAICQLSEASSIIINSTKVSATGIITIRAYKLADGSAYSGSTAGIIRVFAFCKKN